ncbi:MAG: hypothetical protein LBU72_01545 [Burkholderiaceae bacterium]|jgi:hypothetical protein|nr:hypothetical protein [Burkholderiaceae bacterium]
MKRFTQAPIRSAATRVTAGVLVAAALVTAGCAAFKTETAEDVVNRRVQERWQALIKGDFPKAYSYIQPGYRAVVSEKNYAKTFGSGGAWKSVEIFKTQCEPERCTVRLRLTSQNLVPQFARAIPELKGFVDETWIKDQGQWWYYQTP